jgi:hypothetical protein
MEHHSTRAKKGATLGVLRLRSTKGGGFGGVCPALERALNTPELCNRWRPVASVFVALQHKFIQLKIRKSHP